MNFWQDGLSIDEYKTSTLMICLICCLLVGVVAYAKTGDISTNFVSIIQALIYAIAGVNAAGVISNAIGKGGTNYGPRSVSRKDDPNSPGDL